MINSISETTASTLINHPCSESSAQKNKITENIFGLLNLPVELHRKIAWELDAKDYASLRKTCFVLSENLYSFSMLDKILKNDSCCGEFKSGGKKVLNSYLVGNIRKEDYLLTAIKTLRTICISEEENISAFDIKIPLSMESEQKIDLFNTIESIRCHIDYRFFKSCSEVIQEKNISTFSFALDMHFGKIQPGEGFPAKLFFETLQAIYDKKENINKYFIAVIAAELMQLWNKKPPRGTDVSTVTAIHSQYKDLIQIGEIAKGIAKEEESQI